MRFIPALLAALLAAGVGSVALADTTDVKTQTIVEVKKKGAHCEQDPNCFNRYHPAIKPVAKAKPGDLIVVHTRDALDSNLNINSKPKDVTAVDLNLVHPMTGPIYIEGAKRGDVIAIKLIDIQPDEYGYTTIVPGFGFLAAPGRASRSRTCARCGRRTAPRRPTRGSSRPCTSRSGP